MIRLLSMLLLSIASTYAFAITIVHGELLHHKEWVTADVKGIFQDSKINADSRVEQRISKKIQAPALVSLDRVFNHNTMRKSTGFVGEESLIAGESYISITNQTKSAQRYSLQTTICSSQEPHTLEASQPMPFECAIAQDEIQLASGGSISFDRAAKQQRTYSQPGVYDTMLYTDIINQTKFSIYTSSSENILVIKELSK